MAAFALKALLVIVTVGNIGGGAIAGPANALPIDETNPVKAGILFQCGKIFRCDFG